MFATTIKFASALVVGGAMLSWRQKILFGSFQSDVSPIFDEWSPMENQKQWENEPYRSSEADDLSRSSDQVDGAYGVAGRNRNKRPATGTKGSQQVGMADFREPKDGTIKSISLLGERNSGTRWIYG